MFKYFKYRALRFSCFYERSRSTVVYFNLAKSYSFKAVDVASSLNISAFSFGIVGGSFLGGIALDTYGLRSTMLLAAAMVALAVLLMLVENKFENKRQK
ncbi:MFS transporter [Pediococcus pentosaceus]